MALDQIWKQQLTLVTYGNEYLTQNMSFSHWVDHAIFNQHAFAFRDLISQHLLAQHFQIWLEGLKKQGVYKLSLHSSSVLNDEQNPNSNVELLPITHFIVSHDKQKKSAWIFGKELAEWYQADNDFDVPTSQRSNVRFESLWRFELNSKLIKRVEQDLIQPNWDDIQAYTDNELFNSKFAQDFTPPANLHLPFSGSNSSISTSKQVQTSEDHSTQASLSPTSFNPNNVKMSLLPTDYQADYAHESLHRLDALSLFITQKIQHPYHEDGTVFTPDEQLNLRHFSQKLDDLMAKFIVKVDNHYKTARLTPKEITSPFDSDSSKPKVSPKSSAHLEVKSAKYGVIPLILLTIIICVCAYYFGL